jgi:hypothetical protein
MALPVPTTIASGFDDLQGSCYRLSTDQLYVADAGAGKIGAVTAHTHVKTVLGSGFNAPTDVALSADGLHAYVTEEPGTLLRLSLTNMNRSAATVVASGLSGVGQIALDEAHGVAYVAEFSAGHIRQINLSSGATTIVATVAGTSVNGVLVTGDGGVLYVSTGPTIVRFDLSTNKSAVVASGLNSAAYLTWADAGESAILFPQEFAGTLQKLDLTVTPPAVTEIAGPTAAQPYSIAVLSPNQLLIACATSVGEVDFTSSVYTATGPVFLGIGFVPFSDILANGYADTTGAPTYFYQVKNCPFGGTLPLMINWDAAASLGAKFYQVSIAGPSPATPVQVTQSYTDYLLNGSTFEAVTTTPAGGYYPVRTSSQIWLNQWLGLLLDTTGQPNGLNTITITLFKTQGAPAIGSYAVKAMIDNTTPIAKIQQILQQPGNVAVGACGIVNTGVPTFTFVVTAWSPGSSLMGWNLIAYWGNNQSSSPAIASDAYSNHVSAGVDWAGIAGVAVPPPAPPGGRIPWNATVAGDPTSTHCAHSFFLNVWDRVINGWGYVHGVASYQQSVTLMF